MCSYSGLWKMKIIKLGQFPWWHIGLFDPLYSHMASEPPRQLKLIITLSVRRSCLPHSPSFPQQHIQRCWQPLKGKTFKSCLTVITEGDTEWQWRCGGKRINYGVGRSNWVQSQPPPLFGMAWDKWFLFFLCESTQQDIEDKQSAQ